MPPRNNPKETPQKKVTPQNPLTPPSTAGKKNLKPGKPRKPVDGMSGYFPCSREALTVNRATDCISCRVCEQRRVSALVQELLGGCHPARYREGADWSGRSLLAEPRGQELWLWRRVQPGDERVRHLGLVEFAAQPQLRRDTERVQTVPSAARPGCGHASDSGERCEATAGGPGTS